MNYCKWCNHEIGHEEGCPEAPAARQRREEFDAAQVVWVCEEGHVDDHHLSIPGVEERCSRCGGRCEGFKSLDFLARALVDARSTQPVSESPGDSGVEDAARSLADEAARAVCEPRLFHENEGNRQQKLGGATAEVRRLTQTSEEPKANG